MEYVSEQERFEHHTLPHDAPVTPEIIALRALIDRWTNKQNEGADSE